MTTREHETIQRFFNRMSEFEAEQDKCFKELQEINATFGDGNRWCSAEHNLEMLAKTATDSLEYRRAKTIYEKYLKAGAKHDLLMELGAGLADLNFWK